MNKQRFVFLALLAGALAGCSTTQNHAPVVDRSARAKTNEPIRNNSNNSNNGAGAAKPIDKADGGDNRGFYTVKKGDTLIHIALDNGQNYRDLVTWNNLANPNDIKIDQVLRVLPPELAAGGVQTVSVSSSSGVETRPLTTSSVTTTVISPVVATPAIPTPVVASAVNGVVTKSTPRGEKRPFSDNALAEMQKGDAVINPVPVVTSAATTATPIPPAIAPVVPVPVPVTVPPLAKVDAPKVSEKAVAPVVVNNPDDEPLLWMWPTDGKVVANFDEGKSKGIDIAGKLGQQVLAAGSGKVMYAGSGIRGYGNLVIVKHTNNLLSAYAHNKTIIVKEGQSVNKGQLIAEMGNSDSEAIKLHFEIRQQGKPVDPTRFLPNR